MAGETKRCSLCQVEARQVLSRLEGFRAGSFFGVYECPACLGSFCDPLASDPAIYREIYRHSRTLAGYDRYHAYSRAVKDLASPLRFLANNEDCYWFVADYLARHVERSRARLLEVGSGLGYLTYALHRAGYDVRGVELSPVAVEDATRQFGPLYQCRDALALADEGERFDVILLTEVIEHVADPALFVRQLATLLAPGGAILVTTPNKDYGPVRGSPWQTDLPPVHLWWFTKASFRRVAEAAGLSVSFHGFRGWHRIHFARELRKPGKPVLPAPRMSADGAPIPPGSPPPAPWGPGKRLRSRLRYLWHRRRPDLDEGAIIGAVFRSR